MIPNKNNNANQGGLQESLGIALPLRDDVVFLALVSFIQPQPHSSKVQLLDETFPDVFPLGMSTPGLDSSKAWPISVIQKDLKSCLLR